VAPKGWSDSALFVDLPFLDQMGLTSLLTMGVIAVVSRSEGKGADDPKGITISNSTFATEPLYTVGAFSVLVILAFLYAFFWG